ncbi:MAG: Sec-independent protein translocase protein TatB, partial [Proteobacteria bacterium]|nr:Sec-independent protein translocase protein TatB [Pseudomonadota bacterium]
MFDIGLPEMMVLVVVTLLVVGPKDLPKVIRGFARTVAKMRRMVDEFMGSVDEYVRESELSEFKEAMDKTKTAMDVRGKVGEFIDPTGELKKSISPTASANPKKPAAS